MLSLEKVGPGKYEDATSRLRLHPYLRSTLINVHWMAIPFHTLRFRRTRRQRRRNLGSAFLFSKPFLTSTLHGLKSPEGWYAHNYLGELARQSY